MNTRGFLRYVIPFSIFLITSFLLHRNQVVVELILSSRSQVAILIGLFTTFIVGPVWVGYARLNSLDPSDGLKSNQAENIRRFGYETKKRLVRYFLICALLVLMVLLACLLSEAFSNYKAYVVSVTLAAMITFFIFSVIRITKILLLVESTIGKISQWKLEQKERVKQIDQLKKGRVDSKLVPDESLLRYRELGYVSEVNAEEDRSASPTIETGNGQADVGNVS